MTRLKLDLLNRDAFAELSLAQKNDYLQSIARQIAEAKKDHSSKATRRSACSRGHRPRRPVLENESAGMPTKGYRKGISDSKVPLPRFVRTRLSEKEFENLITEAASRSATISSLTRSVLLAHAKGQRAALPQSRGPSNELIRQFARVGNNLNQLARQANVGLVAVPAEDIRRCIDTINALARSM